MTQKLVIAISSTALFDLEESHSVFENDGIAAYADYQIQHENEPLKPGAAFSLVEKLLKINAADHGQPQIEVILLSRNSADTGLRIFNSISHYGLDIVRAAFTSGESPFAYVKAFSANLFLSTNPQDVQAALSANIAAARLLPHAARQESRADTDLIEKRPLRIAFDGDAVLFSDESEQIYQQDGLDAFTENEQKSANVPLSAGPFRNFLASLHEIQRCYPSKECPIRTALVTARAAPTHERVIRTLRSWDVRIDEALFLGGYDKGDYLNAFQADIFFDDQHGHCESANYHVPAGHVLQGVMNKQT